MENMMSCKEAADMWNFTERWVSILCKDGKIPGAVKKGHRWMIPSETPRPVDSRIKTGAYRKEGNSAILPPPLGVTDYVKVCSDYFSVDKTMLIKEFLDTRAQVSLFLRPRHFGKTLFLDMFRTFFEKTSSDTSRYFLSKAIWSCGEAYRRHQGVYPVVFLTFRDLRCTSWSETRSRLGRILQNSFLSHPYLSDSEKLPVVDKELYRSVTEGHASEDELCSSLPALCRMLHLHHGTAPVVMIDDYDTPFIQSLRNGYQEELLYCFQCLLTPVFRDNPHLSFGLMTGVQGVPEGYSGYDLPEPTVFDVTSRQFSSGFGFTEEEALRLSAYYNMKNRFEEMNEWFGGYHFGNSILLNPWSVLKCISSGGRIQPYWNSTGDIPLFDSLFGFASSGSMEHLQQLLQNRIIKGPVDLESRGSKDPSTLRECYGRLVKEGYLNILMQRLRPNGVSVYEMLIPNLETLTSYKKEFLDYLNKKSILAQGPVAMIQEALYSHNPARFQNALKQLLYQSIRNNNQSGDEYYQILLTGLMVLTEEYYLVDFVSDTKPDLCSIQMTAKSDPLPDVRIEINAGKTVKLLYSK